MAKKNVITGQTSSGFKFELDRRQLEDYETFELISEVTDEENVTLLPKLVKKLLGKQGNEDLKNHIREEDGTVSSEKMMEELSEIFTVEAVKN